MQGVYRQGYFMTEESEKAAKWDMLMGLKAEQARLAVLREQAKKIGKDLQDFGAILSNPLRKFKIEPPVIEAMPTAVDAHRTIPLDSLNQEKVIALIKDIEETEGRISELMNRLKDAGICSS
jgi:hypothetical protein